MAIYKKTEESLAKVIKDYIIPSTVGNTGKVLSNDGTNLSWEDINTILPTQSLETENKVLVSNGTNVAWKSISMQSFVYYASENANGNTINTTSYNINFFMEMTIFKDGLRLYEGSDADYTYNPTTKVITFTTPFLESDIFVINYLIFS